MKRWQALAGYLAVLAIPFSQHQLDLGGHSPAMRIWWMLFPLPLLVIGIWDWIRAERSKSELERHIAHAAAMKALLVTAVGLIVLGQIDTGFPDSGAILRYRELWGLPLLAYFFFSVVELKQYTRK